MGEQFKKPYEKIFLDFDGTIFSEKDRDISLKNLELLRKISDKVIIISGNKFESLQFLAGSNNLNNLHIFAYCGLIEFPSKKYFEQKYYLQEKDIQNISNLINKYKYEIRGDRNVISSIAIRGIMSDREKISCKWNKELKNFGLTAGLTGNTTIEITKKGVSKLLSLENELAKLRDPKSFVFLGDEYEKGNDKYIFEKYPSHFLKINNPYETFLFLQSYINNFVPMENIFEDEKVAYAVNAFPDKLLTNQASIEGRF